jgi:hypothetical protein
MARWRERYLELVTAMGNTIPEQYRFHIADLATLDANCAVIDVAQPTPDTMQPYASAYFERYRVLLEGDLPPLAEVFDKHLAHYLKEANARVPFATDRDAYEIKTVGNVDEMELGSVFFGLKSDDSKGSRAAAVAPDGTLWFATLEYDPTTRLVELAFGNEPETSPLLGPAAEWPRPSRRVELTSLAVLSADSFVAALEHWEQPGGDDTFAPFVTFVHASRTAGEWTFETIVEVDTMQQGIVLRGPDDRIFLLTTVDGRSSQPSPNWRGLEISLESGEVVAELPITANFYRPAAIDADGRLYEEINDYLWRSRPDGGFEAVLGNSLLGPRDGRGAEAEMADLKFMQWMADGSAVLVEGGLTYERWVCRELRRVTP